MSNLSMSRRDFLQNSALTAAAVAASVAAGPRLARPEDEDAIRKTRSFNPDMEYRRLGKTNIWVSAVCMGGHWKRIDKAIGGRNPMPGIDPPKPEDQDKFAQNRYDVLTRAIERGINLVDACTAAEVMTYAKALKGRREAMFLDYSWAENEMRFAPWRKAQKLLAGLDTGLKAAELEYVDLWRITCFEKGGEHTEADTEEFIKALDTARKAGKCRFTGISSHDRVWLKKIIEKYPDTIQVIVSPYTAVSKALPQHSLFESVRQMDVGFLGIKPFASNSLFEGDGSLDHPAAKRDDEIARLTLRYILSNTAITAPIPGLINLHQVDNAAAAVKERRQLDQAEHAQLEKAGQEMLARLPEDYQWLKEWQHV
jgi:aryl-alcohol dehydrogenase-like predicted oxidoreductase